MKAKRQSSVHKCASKFRFQGVDPFRRFAAPSARVQEGLLCRSPLRQCQHRPLAASTRKEAGKAANSRQQSQRVTNALLSAAVRLCTAPVEPWTGSLYCPQPATINPWITARNREPPASGFAIL